MLQTKMSAVSGITNTTAQTAVLTSTKAAVNPAKYLNLTPLMMLVVVVGIILVCCICLVSYNSILKHRQQRELSSRHISYGITGEEFLSANMIVRLCGFRRCMKKDTDDEDSKSIFEDPPQNNCVETNHVNERDPLLKGGNHDYNSVTNANNTADDVNKDDVIYSNSTPNQRTLNSDEIVIYEAGGH